MLPTMRVDVDAVDGMGDEMGTVHTFQTPHVEPLEEEEQVLFRVTPDDAQRILRALDETSSQLAIAPSGSRVASSYRRLAAHLRGQAHYRLN